RRRERRRRRGSSGPRPVPRRVRPWQPRGRLPVVFRLQRRRRCGRPGQRPVQSPLLRRTVTRTEFVKERPMLFGTLLAWLFPGRKANRPGPRPEARRLAVEGLEDRRTPAAMLSVRDVTVVEGDTGTLNAVVTVSLTEPHGNSVTVNYKTEDGT